MALNVFSMYILSCLIKGYMSSYSYKKRSSVQYQGCSHAACKVVWVLIRSFKNTRSPKSMYGLLFKSEDVVLETCIITLR